MSWPTLDMEEMIEAGLIKLGRGKVISKKDIAENPGTFPIYSSARLNNGKFGEYCKYMFDKELITWSVDGGGHLFYRPKHKFSVTNVAGILEVTDPRKLNCKFLHYVLSDKHSRLIFDWTKKAHPSVIRRLYKEIPLPPINDQIRIANLLDKVEKLIARRKQHLQQLDDLLKSVFLDMFGDPVRNEKGWEYTELDGYITHLTSGGRGWSKYYSDSGKRFIRSLDVQMNHIGMDDIAYVNPPSNAEADRTRVQSGDVLLTITGSKIGRVCSVPESFEEAFISQHVSIIRTKGLNPVFLSYYLSAEHSGQIQIKKQQYGQAKPGLNLTQIRNFQIPLVDIEVQNLFAVIFDKVEELKSRYQQSLGDLESLYGALSQQAFKGELDLSRVPLPENADASDDSENPAAANENDTEKQTSLAPLSPIGLDEYPMSNPVGRKALLSQIFEHFLNEKAPNDSFKIDEFWQRAHLSSVDYMDEDSVPFGQQEQDFDALKTWVFEALQSNRLEQIFDDKNNRVELKMLAEKGTQL